MKQTFIHVALTFKQALQLANDLGLKIPNIFEAQKIGLNLFPYEFWVVPETIPPMNPKARTSSGKDIYLEEGDTRETFYTVLIPYEEKNISELR